MKLSNATLTICSIALIASLTGCDEPEVAVAEGGEQPKAEQLPNIDVTLPASPNFDEAKSPEKWEDGTYSIFGLRQKMDENIQAGENGTEIEISGWVQEIYVPPVCEEGQLCPPGKQPHFWITDKPEEQGKKRAMMVVSYKFQIPEWEMENWEGVPEVVVEVGKKYKIRGKFKRFSDTGFAHDNGLLDFSAYWGVLDPETGTEGWVFPPNSPNHPQVIAAQEAENLKMQERMAEAAQQKGAAGGG